VAPAASGCPVSPGAVLYPISLTRCAAGAKLIEKYGRRANVMKWKEQLRCCDVAKESKLATWAIVLIRGTPAAVIGHVEAPDAASAIKEAIRQFNITDPKQQRRLAARSSTPRLPASRLFYP